MGFFTSKSDTSENRETGGYSIDAKTENNFNNKQDKTDKEVDTREKSHYFKTKS